MTRPARQPSENSGELSGQGILDNSPTPYGLRRDEPLQAGDRCAVVVEVLDPGNEYTFARVSLFGNGHVGCGEFFVRPDALQRCFLWRERLSPSHTGDTP